MKRALSSLLLAAALFWFQGQASATGFTDIGQDIEARSETEFSIQGALRFRGSLLNNLDLDRGLTPSGAPFYYVPLDDPTAQTLTHADMRLRSDMAVYVPAAALSVKLRLDLLDNLALGSAPDGPPAGALGQEPPAVAFRIKRAYGEVLLPFGLLAAGRMGSHWGLGMLTNGGDCADCDSGDAADRIALMTPLAGHIWALAYDFSAIGPTGALADGSRVVDLDPADDVRTLTFAMLNFKTDLTRQRRAAADRATVEYGAYVSYRWQDKDVPASYLDLALPVDIDSAQVMARGLNALAGDAWFRLTLPSFRLEAEAAVLWSHIEQASLLPGALLQDPVESLQWGFAIESEYGSADSAFGFGLDLGLASGDSAPGFGATPRLNEAAGLPGDLHGAQARPPYDNRIDNFRFHPDYRIDRILFRELVGTVTDCFYIRPHVRYRLLELGGRGHLTVGLFAVASFALESASAPGGEHPLGIELDPTLAYVDRLGFSVVAEYAILLPLAGLDNSIQNISAKPAQLARLRLTYGF
ncbi:MAG: TIGR04551 family protein [Deltaproteobacteria bacterium]|nr:TIGR04551 family protein [Deltaproteobacteria bacterium]